MKKHLKKGSAFLLIWFCSGISILAYKDGNIALGVIGALLSGLSFFLME